MKYYELTTLKTVIFGAGAASPGIQEYLKAPEAKGTLLGAWFADIGSLNEVYLLRSFDSMDDLVAERQRALMSENPFGCLEQLVNYNSDTYLPFDFLPEVESGEFGKVYEIRTYHTKLNGMAPTIEKWREAIPARVAMSKMNIAMYALDGSPRFTQIWPYDSANHRAEVRAQSVSDGVWPPKGGPDWLSTDMKSTLAIPMPFSPLK